MRPQRASMLNHCAMTQKWRGLQRISSLQAAWLLHMRPEHRAAAAD